MTRMINRWKSASRVVRFMFLAGAILSIGLVAYAQNLTADGIVKGATVWSTSSACFGVSTCSAAANRVGINNASPAYPLQVGNSSSNGNGAYVSVGGVWMCASSRDLKENIQDISAAEALTALNKLEPKSFQYKNEPNEEYLGFIAEDVPEMVANQDHKSLSAMDFAALLTKVVKIQQERLDAQERKIQELESSLKHLAH